MRPKLRLPFLICLSVVLLMIVLVTEFSGLSRYSVGMSIAEAKILMRDPYPTINIGLEYDNAPTPEQMEHDAKEYIYDEDGGIILFFNHHGRLIEKRKIKWFGINIVKVMEFARKPSSFKK